MTPEQGFGMLAVGMVVLAIAGTIMYLVINQIRDDERKAQVREEREKSFR